LKNLWNFLNFFQKRMQNLPFKMNEREEQAANPEKNAEPLLLKKTPQSSGVPGPSSFPTVLS